MKKYILTLSFFALFFVGSDLFSARIRSFGDNETYEDTKNVRLNSIENNTLSNDNAYSNSGVYSSRLSIGSYLNKGKTISSGGRVNTNNPALQNIPDAKDVDKAKNQAKDNKEAIDYIKERVQKIEDVELPKKINNSDFNDKVELHLHNSNRLSKIDEEISKHATEIDQLKNKPDAIGINETVVDSKIENLKNHVNNNYVSKAGFVDVLKEDASKQVINSNIQNYIDTNKDTLKGDKGDTGDPGEIKEIKEEGAGNVVTSIQKGTDNVIVTKTNVKIPVGGSDSSNYADIWIE